MKKLIAVLPVLLASFMLTGSAQAFSEEECQHNGLRGEWCYRSQLDFPKASEENPGQKCLATESLYNQIERFIIVGPLQEREGAGWKQSELKIKREATGFTAEWRPSNIGTYNEQAKRWEPPFLTESWGGPESASISWFRVGKGLELVGGQSLTTTWQEELTPEWRKVHATLSKGAYRLFAYYHEQDFWNLNGSGPKGAGCTEPLIAPTEVTIG